MENTDDDFVVVDKPSDEVKAPNEKEDVDSNNNRWLKVFSSQIPSIPVCGERGALVTNPMDKVKALPNENKSSYLEVLLNDKNDKVREIS